jgi:hypothetical protein
MQYVSLSRIPNQYPTLKGNYTLFKDTTVLLNGVYPEKNKINFKLPEFKDITPIPNTTFRFVLSVTADEKDTNPRFFTSKPFYDDIKIAYKVNNPYFPIQALIGVGSIININLKEYFEIFYKLETLEKDTPVNVTKNIFLLDEETEKKFVDLTQKEQQLSEYKTQLDEIEILITDKENTIKQNLNGEVKGSRGVRKTRARRAEESLKKLNSDKAGLVILIDNLQKEVNDTKNANTSAGLLSDKSIIDYEELVKFIDYMVGPPTFSVQEIENGNVKTAEAIGKWEGEWIDKLKRRAAGETIEATIIDERIVSNANEEEKPKTLVGKAIAALEKVPVVGAVVKAVKAVVKFIGKLFSDERLKTDIVKVGEISGINIYKFRYKFDRRKIRLGVIAQEVLKTQYKEFVSIDKETGYYVIDYNGLQQKIDIIGAMKTIQSNINLKTGGFSKLFKAKILRPEPVLEFDNINKIPTDQSIIKSKILNETQLDENLKNARVKKKLFGTININEQTYNSAKSLLKNKFSKKEFPNDSADGYLKEKFGIKEKPDSNQDLGAFILKRKGPKTNRR